jgi:multidrug transporter EmrE-like cation transporter
MSLTELTALSLTEIVGDFGYGNYADTGSLRGFLQGTFGYIGVVFFLIRSLRQGNVMYVNGMWDGMSGIIETIAAYLILGERLTSWMQYLGIVMIGIGLVFLKTMGGTGK